MSSPRIEALLARLYTDDAALAAFLRSPVETAKAFGLEPGEAASLAAVDHDGLVMAAASYRAKRAGRTRRSRWRRAWHAVTDAMKRCAVLPSLTIDREHRPPRQ
jgi:hypothetical protein